MLSHGERQGEARHSIDLHRQLRAFRRHWLLIAVTFLAVTGAAYAFAKAQEEQYAASATLLFRDPNLDQTLFGSQFYSRSLDPAREAATNVKLVSLSAVSRRTAAALREPPLAQRAAGELRGRVLTEAQINARLDVAAAGQSDLVTVTFTDPYPRVAALVANVFAQEYINFRREADRSKIAEAVALVKKESAALPVEERNGAEGRSLRQRGDQLEILQSLQTGNAEIVEGARIPTAPASPKPVRNAILGGFVGLLLGLGVAALLARLDRRLREPQDIEEIFSRPVLGLIPAFRSRRGRPSGPLPPIAAEAYRLLRANLRYFNVSQEIRSVLITSAAPGDGKTTCAWNLARVAAESGSHVLLIETDLRRPSIARQFTEVTTGPGLTTLLASDARLEDVVQVVPVQTSVAAEQAARTMDVLVSGPLPPNPTDLIESDKFRHLLSFAESKYDLVVIDTPPASVVSDAIPLTRLVSGVIVVARLGHSTVDGATHLATQLRNLDAPVLGVVVNALKESRAGYGYYGTSDSAVYAPSTDSTAFMEIIRAAEDPARDDEHEAVALNGNGAASPELSRGRGFLRRGRGK